MLDCLFRNMPPANSIFFIKSKKFNFGVDDRELKGNGKLETCKECVLNEKTEIIQRIFFIISKYTFHPFLLIHINLIKRVKKNVCWPAFYYVIMFAWYRFSVSHFIRTVFHLVGPPQLWRCWKKSICSCAIIYWKLFCFHVTIRLFETKWEMLNVNK